jgi:protein-S-isoprenylcysteine O-methyltransferase
MSTTSNSPATDHPEEEQNGTPTYQIPASLFYVSPQYLSGGPRSLSGISTRAFGLGIALGISTLLSSQLAFFEYPVWRAPFFVAILAVFHYLEFDMTARYNPSDASTDSFLLLSNGSAYTMAHSTALLEMFLRIWLQSEHRPEWIALPFEIPHIFPTVPYYVPITVGMFFVIIGQLVRSLAMRQAKTNFNHIVQYQKHENHILVTNGVYALSRHPAYFGFYWWGLGTQLILGNHFCFFAYAAVLWKFFSHRIRCE